MNASGDLRSILIKSIVVDPNLQMRVAINSELSDQLAEAYKANEEVPAVEVYCLQDKGEAEFLLVNGRHRLDGAIKAGRNFLVCRIYFGTYRDARLAAIRANQEHDKCGLRRSSEDKRRAVLELLTDHEWAQWSDVRIADELNVSRSLVLSVRRGQEAIEGTVANAVAGQARIGADGKSRMPRKKPGPAEADQEEVDAESEEVAAEEPAQVWEPEFDAQEEQEEEPAMEGIAGRLNTGDQFPQDKKIEDLFRQLNRLLGDRTKAMGHSGSQRECRNFISRAYDAWKVWKGEVAA